MTARRTKAHSKPPRQKVLADAPARPAIQVLVVDDHPIVREGVCRTVEREMDMVVCGEASSGPEALAILERQRCDVAVVDISIEGRSGIDLIKEMAARGIDCPVVVLTVHDDTSYAERALHAGAHGYILKQTGAKQITTALRRVLAGEVFVDAKMSAKLVSGLVGRPRHVPGGSPIADLSDRELEVLEAIGTGQGTQAIARHLGIGVSTVESYKASLKIKLELGDAYQLASFASRWMAEQRSH